LNATKPKGFRRRYTSFQIGKRTPAEFAKQMVQMPGGVSALPPLAADTFEMAKTDDNFHTRCLTGFVRQAGEDCILGIVYLRFPLWSGTNQSLA